MQLSQLVPLARKHVGSALSETVYVKTGLDVTRPTTIHAMVTHRCNSRCLYCGFWRPETPEPLEEEMTINQWKRALTSLKEFVGGYFVELSGGEPFMKKDFLELPRFCNDTGIRWGITTNGLAIDEARAAQLVSFRPFNTNISLDAPNSEVHDHLRGIDGAYKRTLRAVEFLAKEREAQKANFPIILKPTVTVKNFHLLPELVRRAQGLGVVVNLQPLDRWTPETQEELWISGSRIQELERVVDELIALRSTGAPLLNRPAILRLLAAHFGGAKAPREAMPCRVGMRNFFISPNGDVALCFLFSPIGNLKHDSARAIWYSTRAAIQRQETLRCERLCLYTCLSHKSLRDRVIMAVQLLRNRRR